MTRNIVPEFTILENNPATVMLQVTKRNATDTGEEFATAADIGGIVYTVTDATTGTPVTGYDNLAISPVTLVMKDAPITADANWTVDHDGYNFRHVVPGTAFPEGGRFYHVEYSITPATGQPYQRAVKIYTNEIYRT